MNAIHARVAGPVGVSALVVAVAALRSTSSVAAAVLHVPLDYPTIQEAVVASLPGDEIVVAPGSYLGPVDLSNHSVEVHSSDGPDVTAIIAPLGAFAVTMSGAERGSATLRGFTLLGASSPGGPGGGGVQLDGGALDVIECVFLGCNLVSGSTTTVGTAIDATFSHVSCSQCSFTSCGTTSDPVVYVALGSSSFVESTVADQQGIAFLSVGDKTTLDAITVVHGSAPGSGSDPLLWALLGSALVRNCDFAGSNAGGGGTTPRIVAFSAADVTLQQCTIHGWATGHPLVGPLSAPGVSGPSSLALLDCTIEDNTIVFITVNPFDGLIKGVTAVEECLISANSAFASGPSGGSILQVNGGGPAGAVVNDNVFVGNTAHGASLRIVGSVEMNRCTFIANQGTGDSDGAAVYLAGNPGTIAAIADCEFLDNGGCDSGAALFGNVWPSLDVVRCDFVGNSALPLFGGWGGAVDASTGTARFHACRFGANSAANGGAVRVGGYDYEFVNCLFADNSAEATTGHAGGGALAAVGSADLKLIHCTIVGSSSTTGGAIFTNDAAATVSLANSIVWGNIGGDDQPILSGPGAFAAFSSIVQDGEAGGVDMDPLFIKPASGDYGLDQSSPAVDAGQLDLLPDDALDLDGDGIVAEPLPLDLALSPRTIDGDADGAAAPDLGCFEFPGMSRNSADLNGDLVVDNADLAIVLAAWNAPGGPEDLNANGIVDGADLGIVLAAWGAIGRTR